MIMNEIYVTSAVYAEKLSFCMDQGVFSHIREQVKQADWLGNKGEGQ